MSPELERAKYINLVTFRKDGREVSTPVWCVTVDGKLYFYTNGNMGKVKRIRATKRVRVAPSDVRGTPVGPWAEGSGRIVADSAEAARIYQAIGRKYWLTYPVLNFVARIAGRQKDRIAVELSV